MKYQWYSVSRLNDLPQAIVVSEGICVSNAHTAVESDQILSLCFSSSYFFKKLFVLSAWLIWLPFAILTEVSKEVSSVPLSIFKNKNLTQLDVLPVESVDRLLQTSCSQISQQTQETQFFSMYWNAFYQWLFQLQFKAVLSTAIILLNYQSAPCCSSVAYF